MRILSRLLAGGCLLSLGFSLPAVAADDGKVFQDWAVKCEKIAGTDKQGCFALQNVIVKESDKVMLNAMVGYPGDRKDPVMLLTLPLGVHLPTGVDFQIDGNKPVHMQYELCNPKGCLVVGAMPAELVNAMKSGTAAKIIVADSQRKKGDIPLSLKGFTAALGSLSPVK